AFAAMALNRASSEVWLCGGESAFGIPFSDCSAYVEGANAWQPRASLPGPRLDFVIAYHAATRELFGFGGQDGGGVPRNDLLVLRGGAWVTATANGQAGSPPARVGHALASDGVRLILFGGEDAQGQAL